MIDLHTLLDKYKSDKNVSGYTDTYTTIFEPIRNTVTSFLEIGLGTMIPEVNSSMYVSGSDYKPGASLRAWRDYFVNAQVYGGDVQPDTQFEEPRITTFLFDSRDGVACNQALTNLTFDIILDDGDHSANAQIKTIHNLISRVRPHGYYIIEDITPGNADTVIKGINSLVYYFEAGYYLLEPHKNLLVIKFP